MNQPEPCLAIFDLGNVVFRCDHMATYRIWARYTGGDAGEIARRHPMNPTWEEFERGCIGGVEYWRHVRDAVGLDLTWEQFVEGWNAIYFEVYEEVAQALDRLRSRLTVVALTNTNALHCLAWQVKYAAVLRSFQRVFVSSDMGLRKPQPAIYRAVLQEIGTPAASALFFDDNAANVAAGRQLGIDSVLVEGSESVIDGLTRRRLI